MEEDGRPWIRTVASMVAIVLVGGVMFGLLGWLGMAVLPESDAPDTPAVVNLGDPAAGSSADIAELGPAGPDDATASVDECEIVDDVVQVGGTLQNTSGASQAFVVHVAVLFDGQLFDGVTADVGVPTLDDGEEAAWASPAGSVDPEDETQTDPDCQVDRVGLGEELAS